jgi:hypothetical protein
MIWNANDTAPLALMLVHADSNAVVYAPLVHPRKLYISSFVILPLLFTINNIYVQETWGTGGCYSLLIYVHETGGTGGTRLAAGCPAISMFRRILRLHCRACMSREHISYNVHKS